MADSVLLRAPIRHLLGSHGDSDQWLAALHDDGGTLIPEPFDQSPHFQFGNDILSPRAAFLPGGRIAIAGIKTCELYRLDRTGPKLLHQYPLDAAAFAVTPTNHLNEFAVLCEDGVGRVFTMR